MGKHSLWVDKHVFIELKKLVLFFVKLLVLILQF